jgi:hypothetical protein
MREPAPLFNRVLPVADVPLPPLPLPTTSPFPTALGFDAVPFSPSFHARRRLAPTFLRPLHGAAPSFPPIFPSIHPRPRPPFIVPRLRESDAQRRWLCSVLLGKPSQSADLLVFFFLSSFSFKASFVQKAPLSIFQLKLFLSSCPLPGMRGGS